MLIAERAGNHDSRVHYAYLRGEFALRALQPHLECLNLKSATGEVCTLRELVRLRRHDNGFAIGPVAPYL